MCYLVLMIPFAFCGFILSCSFFYRYPIYLINYPFAGITFAACMAVEVEELIR